MDVTAFLARHPPFDELDASHLARIAGGVEIEFYPAGSIILDGSARPTGFVYVVRAGSVEVLDDGHVLDLLGEGDLFGELSVLTGLPAPATIRAQEDTLCYLIDQALAAEILGTPGGLAFIGASLRRSLAVTGEGSWETGDVRRISVGTLVRRPPVTCPPEATVGQAAGLMAEQRVSSLLVPIRNGWGILTDHDLRTRILAVGRSSEAPAVDVMTFPAVSVPPETSAEEALLLMLERGFHHVPVMDPSGSPIGMVTDTDLLALERASPFALKSAIERAPTPEEAVQASRGLPQMVVALVDASVDPVAVGRIVGVTVDALTRRLLDLAIHRRGAPPVPWAWLALGSEARHEQALHTDQDHALAYEPGALSDGDCELYFAELAESVTAGLEAAGIPRCGGGAMAVNPMCRRSVAGWVSAFKGWMTDPAREGSVTTSIVFDYRRIAGALDVEPALDEVVASAPGYPLFLRHLAFRALDHRPPTGFLRDFVVEAKGEHAGRLDVKHRGIILVANLARLYAVQRGRTEKTTLARLRGAVDSGRIDDGARTALDEAFRFLWRIRLDHQVRCVREGLPPDDFVDPKALGPIARRGLKEAFSIIGAEQRAVAVEFGIL